MEMAMQKLITSIDNLMESIGDIQHEGKSAKSSAGEALRIASLLSMMMEKAGYEVEYTSISDAWVVWVSQKTGGAVTLWKKPNNDWQLISGVPEMAKLSKKPYPHQVDLLQDPKSKENREALKVATMAAEKIMDKTRDGTLTKDFSPKFSEAIRSRKERMDPGGDAAMGEASGGMRSSMVPGMLKQIEATFSTARDLVTKVEREIKQDLKDVFGEMGSGAQVDVNFDKKILSVEVELAMPGGPKDYPTGDAFESLFKQVEDWAKRAIPWPSEVTGKGHRISINSDKILWGR
jgi:hypothetical protein